MFIKLSKTRFGEVLSEGFVRGGGGGGESVGFVRGVFVRKIDR